MFPQLGLEADCTSSRQSTQYGTDDTEDGGCDGGGEGAWGVVCRRPMEGTDKICVDISHE